MKRCLGINDGRRRSRLLVLLAAMVLLPLAVLTVVGLRLVEEQERVLARQADDLLRERLRSTARAIAETLAAEERALLALAETLPADTDGIRRRLRSTPPFVQALVVDRQGRLLFPPPAGPASATERAFRERTRSLWEDKALTAIVGGAEGGAGGPQHGWHGWYQDGGLHLVLWYRAEERVIALELPRPALLAAVIARLPNSGTEEGPAGRARGASGLTALIDASGAVAYEWGDHAPASHEPPRAEIALAPPVAAWRLRLWLPDEALPEGIEGSLGFAIGLGLAALALVLVVGAIYIYRERTREMRLAAQRVSFVSQVSHELKTPLTNIRLYAELLAADLELTDDDPDGERAQQLGVIVSESQRLSRLIGNVLRFARGQEGRLHLRRAPGVLDEVVRDTVAAVGASLRARGVAVELALRTPQRVALDADAVAQVLANLLSNVEKYAAGGGRVAIATAREGESCRIRVTDRGPGIPASQRERIFEPFQRGSDKLTDGVAGTGIGLSIARRLARLHGGGLRLLPSEEGACFELTIEAPAVADATETSATDGGRNANSRRRG